MHFFRFLHLLFVAAIFLCTANLPNDCRAVEEKSPIPAKGITQEKQSPVTNPKAAIDEKTINGMQWRLVGPFRGGRALAIEGVPGEPNTYYFGGVAGGVWKTSDGGATWSPIFDKQHGISSIGAIAVAP